MAAPTPTTRLTTSDTNAQQMETKSPNSEAR
jgi:hypothetical protein